MGEQLYRKKPGQELAKADVEGIAHRNVLHEFGLGKGKAGGGGAQAHARAGAAKPGGPSDKIDDADLIASMAKRLSVLEKDLRERNAQLQRVQTENDALKSKLKVAEEEIARRASAAAGAPGSAPQPDDSSAVAHLRAENARLRTQSKLAWKQVAEMKAFLNDYGMVWVGDEEQPGGHPAAAGAGAGSGASGPSEPWFHPRAAPPKNQGPGAAAGATGAPGPSGASAPAAGQVLGRQPSANAAGPLPPRPPEGGKDLPGGHLRPDLRRRSFAGGAGNGEHAGLAGSSSNGSAGAAVGEPGARPGSSGGLLGGAGEASKAGPSSASASSAAVAAVPAAAQPSGPPYLSRKSAPMGAQGGAGPGPLPLKPSALEPLPSVASAGSVGGSGAGSPSSSLPFRMADLLARVEELNQLAGDGCGQLVPGKGGHVLHTPDPVRLVVYKDGLQLHRMPARPFADPGVEAVLLDVLDGFFPAPLKNEFPDGVPIKVVDKTRESWQSALAPVNHPALRAGGGGAGGNVRTWADLEAADAEPLSRDKFLSKLPQSVIRNGKVIDIRGGIGNMLGGPNSGPNSASDGPKVALVHTPVDALLTTSQRNHVGPVLPPPSREGGYRPGPSGAAAGAGGSSGGASASSSATAASGSVAGAGGATGAASSKGGAGGSSSAGAGTAAARPLSAGAAAAGSKGAAASSQPRPSTSGAEQTGPQITTLQVKNEDGTQTLIVKLQYGDTIGALRKYLDAHRAKQAEGPKSKNYEIRTGFPPRAYNDLNQTLQDAGLVPNATLFLKATTN